MICANCGTENAAGRRFCDECGATLAAACPNCGESNRPGAKFCGNCGATLGGSAEPALAVSAAPTTRTAAAERRLVTVLFVDLVGFTPFAEEKDPEQVRETLDRYFGLARDAVERHGGTIEKFIGDAVMAVWGTPTAHEDDAERAVRAALELLDSVRSLGPGIEARAGVMTGEAAVTLGADGQGMVAGDMVNTASRLQSVAPAGTVLVNEANMHAAAAAIAFEPAGEQELKGKSAPVTAYKALRVVAHRGGQNRSEGLEAPFVGRDEELRQLKEQLHATTRDQRARLVSIIGPAGIGKSRLTWELEKYLDGVVETVFWHRGRSPSYGEGVTFWALGEMVRRRAQLAETDDEATTRGRIAATVADTVTDPDERSWVEPALLTLLGLEPAPAGGRDALFAAWRIFFERLSERNTTALVFEDLQWADTGLLDFIEHLLEWSKNKPILVITLSRPELYERRPNWGAGHRLLTSMSLEPLPDGAMRDLLAGLVPGLPEAAVNRIVARADGIPLYAVETVRMLVAEGRLEQVDDVYRPKGDLGNLAVPETLRSLIASRLDALDAGDRSLLQDGAVLGQRFTIPALAAISGLPTQEIETRLRTLVRREVLELEADPRSPERGQYGFVQSLIREVAYGTLARPERRSRHLAAARYFETLGDEELAGVLASHYLAAHESSAPGPEADALAVQARIALRAAAERAASLGAHDQAISYVEQALTVTADPAEKATLLELAATSANVLTHDEVAQRYAREAIAIHEAASNEDAVARISALLGRILIDAGNMTGAIAAMEEALERAGTKASESETARLLATLSRALMRSDEPEKAVATADRALDIAERLNLEPVVAEALVNKAAALQMSNGRRRESAALHELAVNMAHRAGLLELELRGTNNLSVALIEDDPQRALDIVRNGVALARRVGQRSIFVFQAGTVGIYSFFRADRWDEALADLEESVTPDTSPALGNRNKVTALIMRIACGEDTQRVKDQLADVEQVANTLSDPQIIGLAKQARAEIAIREGRYGDAYKLALSATEDWRDFMFQMAPIAAFAAFLARDVASARAVERFVLDYPSGGAVFEAERLWMAAGIKALEGDRAGAVGQLRAGVDAMHASGFAWYEALALLSAVSLLPNEPEAKEWAAEARRIFERVGAQAYLDVLDRIVGQPAERAGSARAAVTPAEVPAT